MNYIDIYGRYHDKPCVNDMPSSNNGWIYTAYAQKAGLPVDMYKLNRCMNLCVTWNDSSTFMSVYRSPGKAAPPISRDEVLGMVSLGFFLSHHIKNWNFSPYPLPKFSLLTLIKQLWELRPRLVYDGYSYYKVPHRNYFWQNNLDQLYRFAFSVPVQDRHFILKSWDKFQWYNPVHIFYAAVAKVDSWFGKSGIKWLKYGGEKNGIAMTKEFPKDHPIYKKFLES